MSLIDMLILFYEGAITMNKKQISCDGFPLKYNYVNIDSNQNICILDNRDICKYLDITNIYIDRNPFNLSLCDPVGGAYYKNRNIYMIESGQIFIIGFYSELVNSTTASLFNGWINFDTVKVHKTGIYDISSIIKTKFNPNRCNQFDSDMFMPPKDKKLYSKIILHTPEYNQPQDPLHKLVFIKGYNDAKMFKTNTGDLRNYNISFSRDHCFSLSSYYFFGMKAFIELKEEQQYEK
jgi:hypothetical protein